MIVMAPVAREELPEYGKYISMSSVRMKIMGMSMGTALHCTVL